jgi:lipopolysaccharide transport system ATP-binding protein
MSDLAITVENLGKLYKIGLKKRDYLTLRESLTNFITAPFRSRQLSHNNQFWALKDVSFELGRGEVLGIIGRNGAGKTTLLKILSRIADPTEGQAIISGRVSSLLEVGTGFHPELTGRENTYLNGAILGMKKAEIDHKFDEIAAFAEVERFLDTPVKHYSSGMYVRLAFAVAAHLEPDILIVDEVLAVGDAAFQKKCLGKMEDVSTQGRTILFVSHNLGAVRALCQKALLLDEGKVTAFGKTEAVINEYQNKVTGNINQVSSDFAKRPRKNICTSRALVRGATIDLPTKWRDPFRIFIDFESMARVDTFSVEWFIKDSYGARLMSGLSALSEEIWFAPGNANSGQIKCTVKEWRLPGGRYSLSVMLTKPLLECFDYIEDILIFDVPDMLPGKPGFIFSKDYGVLLPEISWDCDPETKLIYMGDS